MKKRYISETESSASGSDISHYQVHNNETIYPPSPTMSMSRYHEDNQDFDGPWQQQQVNGYIQCKVRSRTSSPQDHPVTTMVSCFRNSSKVVTTPHPSNNVVIGI